MKFPSHVRHPTALSIGLLAAVIAFVLTPGAASACGCFAMPDVASPLLQAGEKILFVIEGGQITMHVQLRYDGRSGDFGWLLPLPAIPQNVAGQDGIDIGADELFDQLEARTRPYYVLTTVPARSCGSAGDSSARATGCSASPGCGSDTILGAGPGPESGAEETSIGNHPDIVVKQESVGPFDAAILRADNRDELLRWLMQNQFVVPTGADQAVAPYVRPGAYFLALKLGGKAKVGDIQPVVLRYASDLPMIPITLTSVGATQKMPIQVWTLAGARAIPRNYSHVQVNDAQLDWLNSVSNYNDVVIKALAEAPQKRGFVTEYAGSSARMRGILDAPGRFDVLQQLSGERDPVRFITALAPQSEPQPLPEVAPLPLAQTARGFTYNGQLFAVLGAHVPIPRALAASVTPEAYYRQIAYYLGQDRAQRPAVYADIEAMLQSFDPAALVRDLTERIVQPTLRAGALFGRPALSSLTRLYTTLSPEDMTVDPAFSLSQQPESVSNIHRARLQLDCWGDGQLILESALGVSLSARQIQTRGYSALGAPFSLRTERLRESGTPEVVIDNHAAIREALTPQGTGCSTTEKPRRIHSAAFPALCAITVALLLGRRRLGLVRVRPQR